MAFFLHTEANFLSSFLTLVMVFIKLFQFKTSLSLDWQTYYLKINNTWFWSIFKLLSDSFIKPKRAAWSVKSVKSRSVSEKNKNWFQRILVTEHLWKTCNVVSASVWKKNTQETESTKLKKLLIQIKHVIDNFIMEAM